MKLILVPWIICVAVMYLRGIELSYYCKKEGYKTDKSPVFERIVKNIRIIAIATIPLFNIILIWVYLTKNDEDLVEPALKAGTIYAVDEEGNRKPYNRFNFKY